jgi:hypothetical protein
MSKPQAKAKLPGAPSKYRKEYDKEIVEFFKEDGSRSFVEYAVKLGVSKDSLYEWAKVYPSFSDAMKVSKGIAEAWWTKVLTAQAIGKFKGSPSCTIFSLKARFGWRDDVPENQLDTEPEWVEE